MPRKQVAVVDDRVCCPSVTAAPLSEAEATDLARVLSALADPVRLRLLSLIAEAGEICSCDLLAPLGKSQPTVSHHTKALADVGLIVGEKEGRWIWWSIVPERLDAIRAALAPSLQQVGSTSWQRAGSRRAQDRAFVGGGEDSRQ